MRWRRVGALAGLAGALVFALLWTMAVEADGTWEFGADTLSELGRMDGKGRDYFDAGVILASLLWVPYSFALVRFLPKNILSKAGGALLLASAISLLAIGMQPIDAGTPHTIASWAFFVAAMVSLLLLAKPVGESEVFGRVGMAPTVATPLVSMALLGLTGVPLAEAVAVMGLMAWASILSVLMLLNYRMTLRNM